MYLGILNITRKSSKGGGEAIAWLKNDVEFPSENTY